MSHPTDAAEAGPAGRVPAWRRDRMRPRWRRLSLGVAAAAWLAAAWGWHAGVDAVFWPGIAAVVALTAVSIWPDARPGVRVDATWRPTAAVALRLLGVAVIGVYAWHSLSDLETNPPGLFADELEIGLETRRLVIDAMPTLRLPIFYEHFGYPHNGALTLYATAPFVAAMGLSDLALRLSSVVWTALAMLVLLATTRRLGWRHGWVAVAALALSPVTLHLGRIAMGHAPSLLLIAAGWYAFVRARDGGGVRWALGSGLALGVSVYGNGAWYIAAPATLASIAVGEVIVGGLRRDAVRRLAMMALGFGAGWTPIVVKMLTDEDFFERLSAKDKVDAPLLSIERLTTMLDNYPKYFSPRFLFEVGEAGLPGGFISRHSVPGAGLFGWVMLPLVILGVVALLRRREGTGAVLAAAGLVMLVLSPLPDLFTTTRLNPPYTFAVYPMLLGVMPLAGYGVDWLARTLGARGRLAWLGPVSVAAIAVVVLVGAVRFHAGPFARYPEVSADFYGWQYGGAESIAAFDARRDAYDQFLFDPDYSESLVYLDFYLIDDPELRARTMTGSTERIDLDTRQLLAIRRERYDALMQTDQPVRRYLRVVDVIRYPAGDTALYLVEVEWRHGAHPPRGW